VRIHVRISLKHKFRLITPHPIQMAEDNLTALGACMNASSGHGLSLFRRPATGTGPPLALARTPHSSTTPIFFSSTLIATQLSSGA
jgi:hypothetical protein